MKNRREQHSAILDMIDGEPKEIGDDEESLYSGGFDVNNPRHYTALVMAIELSADWVVVWPRVHKVSAFSVIRLIR